MEADAAAVSVFKYPEGMLIVVVDDFPAIAALAFLLWCVFFWRRKLLPCVDALFAVELVVVEVSYRRSRVLGPQGEKSAVEEDKACALVQSLSKSKVLSVWLRTYARSTGTVDMPTVLSHDPCCQHEGV